jgi:hypothetical protein
MKDIKKVITTLGNRIFAFAKVYGPAFVVYAIVMDLIDEIIIPGILVYLGFPMIGGMAVLGDLDWLTYPLYFLVRGMFNRK